MENSEPIKYSDLFQPDDSIKQLKEDLADLAAQYRALMDGIKSESAGIKAALNSVSSATSSGREEIKKASAYVDKLAKKEADLAFASTETAKQLIDLSQKIHDKNSEMKLSLKINKSAEGSYDNLSARYSKVKKALNAMTLEERKTTETGKALEKESYDLMVQMKQLQEATGKHVLSVGNYGVATATMASDIRNGIQALTQLRIEMSQLEEEGQKGSDRWAELSEKSQRLSADLKGLKRQYQIVKLEANALGQQTGYLNDAIGVLSTGAGGLSALTGTMKLFGNSAVGAAQSLVELNAVMTIANGISQIYNGIFKQGNILLFIRNAQLKAATVAQNLQTKSTVAAKIAQYALNAAAKANPYILLASAIAAVVGVLVAFVRAGAETVKTQQQINAELEATIEYLAYLHRETKRGYTENQKALEQELAIAKARKAGYLEIQKIEKRAMATRKASNAYSRGFYGNEIDNIEKNRKEIARLQEMYKDLLVIQASGKKKTEVQFDLNGPAEKVKVEDAIDIIQKRIDLLGKDIEVAVDIIYDQEQIDADAQAMLERHKQEMLEIEDLERDSLREREDAAIALMDDRFDKQRVTERAATERAIEDLQIRLDRENDLTLKARQAINKQIVDLRKKLNKDLFQIDADEIEANTKAIRDAEDAQISALKETQGTRRLSLQREYEREIEDLQFRLDTEKDLTDQEYSSIVQQMLFRYAQYVREKEELEDEFRLEDLQKEIETNNMRLDAISENSREAMMIRLDTIELERQQELIQNRQLTEELRQDEDAINRKWDQKAAQERLKSENTIDKNLLTAQQRYDAAEFNLHMHSERQKNKFALSQRIETLEQELSYYEKLLKTQTGEARQATQTTIDAIKKEIEGLKIEMRKGPQINSIWELFGFDSDMSNALQTVVDEIVAGLQRIADARMEVAEAALSQAQAEVEAAQRVLDFEREARANGYANQVETAQKELAFAKEQEKAAIKQKKEAQQEQERIDTKTQVSSLITASANLWSSLSSIPYVGYILAAAAIATMWTSFTASKIKAKQIASETYGEGTVELLSGGSHQSGNDIDLGTKPDGTRRRAEGGEYFAVINKRNSRKYGPIIPDVIRALNNGTFSERYMNAHRGISQIISPSTVDLTRVERDLRDIRDQRKNETQIYIDPQGHVVTIYKNLKRTILN